MPTRAAHRPVRGGRLPVVASVGAPEHSTRTSNSPSTALDRPGLDGSKTQAGRDDKALSVDVGHDDPFSAEGSGDLSREAAHRSGAGHEHPVARGNPATTVGQDTDRHRLGHRGPLGGEAGECGMGE